MFMKKLVILFFLVSCQTAPDYRTEIITVLNENRRLSTESKDVYDFVDKQSFIDTSRTPEDFQAAFNEYRSEYIELSQQIKEKESENNLKMFSGITLLFLGNYVGGFGSLASMDSDVSTTPVKKAFSNVKNIAANYGVKKDDLMTREDFKK